MMSWISANLWATDRLIGDSDDDFELDAESTDLLDDFLDSELSDNTLSADELNEPKAESLGRLMTYWRHGIEDELWILKNKRLIKS